MLDRNFRLPRDIRPERYALRFEPDLPARAFRGEGRIDLVLDEPRREIVLHGLHVELLQVTAEARGRSFTGLVTAHAESQTLTLRFEEELPAGATTLALAWTGKLHEDLRGFYFARDVALTQLEAADARRLLPCFDEPWFKAVWDVSLIVPRGLAGLGNGAVAAETALPDGARLLRFAPTPRMSSYLVALVVGPLVSSDSVIVRDIAVRSWALAEKRHLFAFAQACTAAVLPLLEDYFDRPYPFGKLDHVAVPDFEAGAMENAGCITYRESRLLLEPDAPLGLQKQAAETITHEIAHMWFGNLVTMVWWDDLWLNEAFATWIAFKIVDRWRPEWRMWDDFDEGKAAALALDGLASTHPVKSVVRNADEATENFDLITYEKGGAILRMIEGFLGEDPFRQGIRGYMKRHAFANATADDLWAALEESSGQPIGVLANSWLNKGGFPLLEMTREGGVVRARQRPFAADPARFAAGSADLWPVPIVLRWADDAGVHLTRWLLREERGEMPLQPSGAVKFLCGNAGSNGFYRMSYTPRDLAALSAHRKDLEPVERVSLIADAWHLFRAGAGPLEAALDLIADLSSDDDYTVMDEAVARLSHIEKRVAGPEEASRLRSLAEEKFLPHLERLGWDARAGESDDTRLARAATLRALALVGRVGPVVKEAAARSRRAWAGEAGALDANLLDSASVAAARAGDQSLFDDMKRRAETSSDPAAKSRALASLAAFESPGLVNRSVDLLLADTVSMQDSSSYLRSLMENPAARELAFALVQERWPEVHKKTAGPALTKRVVESLGELANFGRREDVEAFYARVRPDLAAVPAAIEQTRERMRIEEDVQRRARPALAAWLAGRQGA